MKSKEEELNNIKIKLTETEKSFEQKIKEKEKQITEQQNSN